MIREKKTYPFIKKYKSIFFWRECRFCNNEFKNEKGFIIEELLGSYTKYTYCCPYCALTEEEVKSKVLSDKTSSISKLSQYYFPNSIDDFDD